VAAVEITMKPRPSLVDNFVGREDILHALRTTHFGSRSLELNKPAVSVLMGLGGSGKTQIALKFALEYERRCGLFIYWIFRSADGAQIS
jgi:signal recognition particle GTPase